MKKILLLDPFCAYFLHSWLIIHVHEFPCWSSQISNAHGVDFNSTLLSGAVWSISHKCWVWLPVKWKQNYTLHTTYRCYVTLHSADLTRNISTDKFRYFPRSEGYFKLYNSILIHNPITVLKNSWRVWGVWVCASRLCVCIYHILFLQSPCYRSVLQPAAWCLSY